MAKGEAPEYWHTALRPMARRLHYRNTTGGWHCGHHAFVFFVVVVVVECFLINGRLSLPKEKQNGRCF